MNERFFSRNRIKATVGKSLIQKEMRFRASNGSSPRKWRRIWKTIKRK